MLTVHNIHKKIEGVPVLHNISFSIEPGSIVGLVGRNGAGKTTLLRTLVGILEVDAGEVLFDKQNIMTNPQVKSSIAYIPDNHNAFNSYSVQEASSLYKAIYRDFDEAYFHEEEYSQFLKRNESAIIYHFITRNKRSLNHFR
jgi:ABC-2 type transport system ATP-binding protein